MIWIFLFLALCVVLGNYGSNDVFWRTVKGALFLIILLPIALWIGNMGWIAFFIFNILLWSFLIYRVQNNTI